jgi:DNA topoisomerase-1
MDDLKNNNPLNYNKRQFWAYKRLHTAKGSHDSDKSCKKKSKKVFHVVNGRIATDRELTKRLDTMYIPPAYKNIVIAKSANNKIQAIGIDKKGRKQYMYNQSFIAKRNDRKYDDILELGKKIITIENDNISSLRALAKKSYSQYVFPDDYIPIIVHMLRSYHFRIGNEKYARENNSHGITTLKSNHIKFHGPTKFTIEFIGKKGIVNTYTDDNELMASILKKLIKHYPENNNTNNGSKENFLFSYKAPTGGTSLLITPDHIQTFFQDKYNSYITPKMFRTWYGNYHMIEHLRNLYNQGKLQYRMNKSDISNTIKNCSEHVSSKLNNTPTISKKSYIDNKLLALVMKNPYRMAAHIPDNKEDQHKYLYKIIMKLRV